MNTARQPRLPQHQLNSGALVITDKPQWVVTVLGSCVAVTMFHRPSGWAAICHAMLPRPHQDLPARIPRTDRERYVSLVIPCMVQAFAERQISPEDLEVKLFGGANILQVGGENQPNSGVGTANVVAAREWLETHRLRVLAENVGGLRGRKILFNTQTGDVLHKHLAHMHDRLR